MALGDKIKKYQLEQHLLGLKSWLKQVEEDADRAAKELNHSSAEILKLSTAIVKVQKELETLNDNEKTGRT